MAPDGSDDGAADTVRSYYDALERGDPIAPFFGDGETVVKVGVSERLVGGDDVAAGLREQTETTRDWRVDGRDLRVTERDDHAWFADRVTLGWTDDERYEFDTRWSGTLERRTDDGTPTGDDGTPATDGAWRFVGMHVSTPRES